VIKLLQHPKPVLAVAGVLAILSAVMGRSASEHLSYRPADFYSHGSESFQAEKELEEHPPVDSPRGPSVGVIAPGLPGTAGARVAGQLRRSPLVARVGKNILPSRDGKASYVLAWLAQTKNDRAAAAEVAREVAGPGILVGGQPLARQAFASQIADDLRRAQLVALPLLLLLGLWVFRSVVAALLPVALGGFSLLIALGAFRLATELTPLSVFSLDIALALALGLGVDYSLLMTSRFREELAAGDSPERAALQTWRTAGRTVAFSSAAIAVSFSSLLLIPIPFVRSIAFGGGLVAIVSGLSALVLLPALLVLLGPKVNALAPQAWQRSARKAGRRQAGPWYRIARLATGRPILVASLSALVLIVLAVPALSMRFTGLDLTSLPSSSNVRRFAEHARRDFDHPLVGEVALAVHGDKETGFSTWGRVNAVAERTGLGIAFPVLVQHSDHLWQMRVNPTRPLFSEESQEFVSRLRGMNVPASVAGNTAAYADSVSVLEQRLPAVLAIVALSSLLFVYLATRSLVLPIKALAINVLTLGAALGLTVFIFQGGRLEGLLDFTSQGALNVNLPLMVAAASFGLLTDYGLFLFMRIQEERQRGASDREAIVFGLERTGRVITAAALLFSVAVGAFATSGLLLLKVGAIAIVAAVALDAFLVRPLLVPSSMAILGRWNWWPRRMPGETIFTPNSSE
jgi:uncharacterized membrane protein YdfJ with MMPL/SSD domain